MEGKKENIYLVKEEDLIVSDALFYEKYKEYLSGVTKVTGTHYDKITLYLESGLSFEASKFDIQKSAFDLILQKEIKSANKY